MRLKVIIGIVIVICGVCLFFLSNYIATQVAIGRGEISRGQSQVNTANSVIDNTTRVQGLGGLFTAPAQNKIDKGTVQANSYARLSRNLKIAGFVVAFLGILCVFLSLKKKKGWHF